MADKIRDPELRNQSFVKLRVRLWNDWQERHTSKLTDTLYHYTDAGGLLGIFDSKKLWATDARYLNDSSEVEYARGLLREVIEARYQANPSEVVAKFLPSAFETFDPYQALYCPFVACFCEKGDLLSQWRGYADRGGGYSLGFSAGALLNHPKSVSEHRMLRKVEYEEDEQVRLLQELVGAVCDTLDTESAGRHFVDVQFLITDACRLLREMLTEYLPCFKHPGFTEEQEWRIVHPFDPYEDTDDRIRFRTSRGAIAPYVKLDCTWGPPPFWGKLPLDSVSHGPTQHPEEAKQALRILLLKQGYHMTAFHEDVQVMGSDVPLR